MSQGRPPLPDEAFVVRGGTNTPELVAKGVGTHPSGLTGVSVESAAGTTLEKLSESLKRYGRVGVTTVGRVRALGGDVIPTSGHSPNHATLIGLTPEQLSGLLNPTVPNPAHATG